jgi:hypothetical protein
MFKSNMYYNKRFVIFTSVLYYNSHFSRHSCTRLYLHKTT